MTASGLTETPRRRPRVWIGPVAVEDLSREDLIGLMSTAGARTTEPVLIANLNAHALNLALKSDEFAAALRNAAHCFCDGFGILLLARLLRLGWLEHRNTPPDFVDEVYARMHAAGLRVYLLGDRPDVVETYAAAIGERWPGLAAGFHHGFIFKDEKQQAEVREELGRLRPDLVLLGMGMPRQEMWFVRNRAKLPPGVYASVGALFSWKAGHRRRGPRWATDHGLEWLYRLVTEPAAMGRRYVIGLPEVFMRLLVWHARHRKKSREENAA